MRFHFVMTLALLIPAAAIASEPEHSPVNIYILRGAEQLSAPHTVTYRVFEWEQMRGRWILPDLGYYDTGYGQEQIWIAGGGADLVRRRNFTWEQEIYFAQEAGPKAHNQRSLWLWPVLDFTLPRRFFAQVAAYPTFPLDRSQRWSYNVDRAKLERNLSSHWDAGIGYAGGIGSARTWQSEPFITVTRKTRAGSFEFWFQQTPNGTQVQARYMLVRDER